MIKNMYFFLMIVLFSSAVSAGDVKVTFFGKIVEVPELVGECKFRLEGFFIKNSCMKSSINLLNTSHYNNEDKYKLVSVLSSHKKSIRYSIVKFSYN